MVYIDSLASHEYSFSADETNNLNNIIIKIEESYKERGSRVS